MQAGPVNVVATLASSHRTERLEPLGPPHGAVGSLNAPPGLRFGLAARMLVQHPGSNMIPERSRDRQESIGLSTVRGFLQPPLVSQLRMFEELRTSLQETVPTLATHFGKGVA